MTMTNAVHHTSLLAVALDAWDHGLSVVRVRTDGSKRPVGEWKAYQTERADRPVVEEWFTHGNHGLGVICGAVSGDLEMLELEGRFITDIGSQAFKDAAKEAGLALLLSRLINGYMVISPSNGRHFYYRVDGEAAPNTKLARRPGADGTVEVLIETRGEGGFVVAPPSSGTVHPSGRAWQTKAGTWAAVPTITVDERDALFALCRSFDAIGHTAPTPVAPTSNPVVVRPGRAITDGSWMDALVDHLRATQPMQQLLEHYGWAHAYTDRHGRTLMTRPGKDEGVSGSVNTADRLLPFSTSTPFETGRIPPTTYDQLDVIAAYEHRGDRKAAARTLAERAGIIGTTPKSPPPNVDPATGEIVDRGPLDDTFWSARDYLAQIHTAALSRMVAPAAVLGCVLARVAAWTPPSTCLPPTIGSNATLGTYVALYARSGGGKSTSTACAAELLPVVPPGCVGPLPLGSGEGLIDAYFELVEDVDGGGKKTKVKRQTRHGALFMLDEGQVLAEVGNRRGSTVLPILRSAWSGSDAGQANASIETRRILRAGSYSIGLVSLWQADAAARLIEDADGGTPQRFVWFDVTSNEIDAADDHEWPGPIDWQPPAGIVASGHHRPNPLDIHPDIRAEVRQHHAAVTRGEKDINPLDTHRNLAKMKIAAILGMLDGRYGIELGDWELAERVMTHSDGVRSWVQAEAARKARDREESTVRRQIAREAVVEDSAAQRALERATKAVAKLAERHAPTPITRRMVMLNMSSRHRQILALDDVIAEAERLHWIAPHAVEGWVIGDASPR